MNAGTARYDVAIIGGAIIGSSVAYFLKALDPGMSVCVIEPDPTYEWASTVRASGGARRLFSCPENIEMSKFSIDFIKNFDRRLAVDGAPAHAEWREQGYLFIVPPEGMHVLEDSAKVQQALGVEIELLDRAGLQHHFPSMFADDLAGGVYSPRDGWCDPNGLLQGFRRKALALGVTYLKDKVAALSHAGGKVAKASLASGSFVRAEAFVNATGAWAAGVCKMVGMELPVYPLRRYEHFFTGQKKIESLPYVKDVARLAFRPEREGYSGGLVNSDAARGFNFEVDHEYFDKIVWPALAHRFPSAFEGARCHRTWSGLYEQCELDGNPIIGNWKRRLENFYVVSGFSGHGMMHAPAAGRAIAELIKYGRFKTIDLTRLSYERVEKNAPYPERGIL